MFNIFWAQIWSMFNILGHFCPVYLELAFFKLNIIIFYKVLHLIYCLTIQFFGQEMSAPPPSHTRVVRLPMPSIQTTLVVCQIVI